MGCDWWYDILVDDVSGEPIDDVTLEEHLRNGLLFPDRRFHKCRLAELLNFKLEPEKFWEINLDVLLDVDILTEPDEDVAHFILDVKRCITRGSTVILEIYKEYKEYEE